MMDRPIPSEPPADGGFASLCFTLNQAAALCGIAPEQLQEWTDCGYVAVSGPGECRYDRESLRQILSVRDAIWAGRAISGSAPASAHGSIHRSALARARARAARNSQPPVRPEARRPEEFNVPADPMDDAHLTLQTGMFFALNAGSYRTAEQMALHFTVEPEQMERVLAAMVADSSLIRTRHNGGVVYHAGRTHLHGPNPREQRIRATRRPRLPSRPR